MRTFLLLVLSLFSFTVLFPQTKTYTDVSPDGKQTITYTISNYNNRHAAITDTVPFGSTPEWQGTLERQVGGLAWADYDHDGDLDLALGNYHSNSYPPINEYETQIYRNDNGVLTSTPAWSSTDMRSTTDVEWADINGDGYPDLLAANGDESQIASVMYMNSASGLETTPSWISNDFNWTVGAAFGDINGDGYVDLAFGNQGNSVIPQRPICVFYNVNGTLHTAPDYLSGDEMITNSVALADADNSDLTEKIETFTADGTGSVYTLSMVPIYKLDSVLVDGSPVTLFTFDGTNGWVSLGLIPSNGSQVVIKYRYIKNGDLAAAKWVAYSTGVYFNDGSGLNSLPGWTVGNTESQKGIAWADMDNDGYMDLAVGGSGVPSVVYKNNNGTLSSSPVWTSSSSNTSAQDLAWGDINNDGYPELAVIHFGYSRLEIFMNNSGVLETSPSWTYTTGSPGTALSFGDVNGDGFLDLAVGTARAPVAVFLNQSIVPVELKSFTSENVGSAVKLRWTTATETNNKGFEIERLKDFPYAAPKNWEQIGYVDGNGTSAKSHNYIFIDNNPGTGNYSYRLKQVDYDGSYKYSEILNVNVNDRLQFDLSQNYPNPFNPSTKISYQISTNGHVELKVYNSLGQETALLVNSYKQAGRYDVIFDASYLPSGVYFYKLTAGDFTSVKKMILMR